ncbi:hypothetical protein HAX54_015616 [Datura stramonium]|uniref:Uncharacterized protein n=1 Tax=Datura stramonium TaxID=4076 RepID=A0ABS8RG46_DATST|nr:hypothetical protein [Datura stramonium]
MNTDTKRETREERVGNGKEESNHDSERLHGGSLQTFPTVCFGVMVRPSDRSGFDRQASWGNSMGRPEHRLRPGSAGATRNFDEKTPFLSHNAPIGRL